MINTTYSQLSVRVTLNWEDIWISHCFEYGASGIETCEETQKYKFLRVFFTDMSISTPSVYDIFFQIYDVHKEDLVWIKNEIHQNKDWLLEWKRFFHPISVGQKFIVCPPWDIPENNVNSYKILIDPGNGFGSGSHPSTVLSLKLLEAYVLEKDCSLSSILDVGTGSGILLIASKYFGLTKMLGIDIDLPSIYDAQNNFRINNMSDKILTVCGGPECIDSLFDIVISNMMIHELAAVRKSLVKNVRPEGVLILSGFYVSQKEKVETYFEDFQPVLEMITDEWCGFVMKKFNKN